LFDYLLEPLDRFGILVSVEIDLGDAEPQLGQKLLWGQKAYRRIVGGAVGSGNNYGRRPADFVFIDSFSVFSDMQLDGNEVLVNKLSDICVRISLGIQPLTAASVRVEEIE
jgi:hypothetical protein